ncbi:hypothetical protein LP421_14255 [Rhizobium sp. RCAM05350]|nr:hypothetical protein LP421_14255 [Rhizobium sp. RCAM05350]
MLFGLIFVAATAAADISPAMGPTADALQSDLQTAYSCKDIDGRKVWKGGLAYYIQSFVYDDEAPDDTANMATDAVLPEDNSAETMQEFEQACMTMAPTASTDN